jgi:hypothetical protein
MKNKIMNDGEMPFTTSAVYKDVVLERIRSYASSVFSGHALQSLELSQENMVEQYGHVLRLMVEELGEYVENREKTVSFSYPDGWFQMFKQKYFNAWLKERFPIRMKTVKRKVVFKKAAVYPKFPQAFPPDKYGREIRYKTMIYEE